MSSQSVNFNLREIDIDLIPDATLIADARSKEIVEVNKEATKMLDCSEDDLIGIN